jgi:hypothetical protein
MAPFHTIEVNQRLSEPPASILLHAIASSRYLSGGGWCADDGLRDSHPLWCGVPAASGIRLHVPVQGYQPLLHRLATPPAQRLVAWHADGLGGSRFARHYSGTCFASSGYMRCFSSPTYLPP